jgi:ribosomal protein S18 acetylase RimI-like enzyme
MSRHFVAKATLNETELAVIHALVQHCNEHDGIDLKVNPDMLQSREGKHTEDFLCYQDGQLVGFLGQYSFHGDEAEVSGMVHPDYRRKGIFRELQAMSAVACKERSIPQHLFIVQRESASGKAFVEKLGATYSFSEYWMDLQPEKRSSSPKSDVHLRLAEKEDLETLIWLNIHGFQMDEERAQEMTLRIDGEAFSKTYLILVDEKPVGKISVSHIDHEGFIFGFCVHPDEQGKGYGRQALGQSIELLLQEGAKSVSLEVACENSGALSLYESCGFTVKSANDYYKLSL